ncbi:hypothetical protein AMJ85_09340, partial [candidate division BRC1 bacterium SM23_51]
IRELINRCFEKMTEAVDRFGGTVVNFLGDAILAAFGAPRAHEDDPERAIRAALDMIEGVRKVGRPQRLDLGLSVGIHAGEVVVGGISVGDRVDFTAFGDAVNTASRLQNVAGFREILISQRVYQQVRHAFEFENRPPAFVKNKREPIINYRVVGSKGRLLRRPLLGHGIVTRLIGRDRELARLDKTAQALSKGRSAFVCIVGEAGVGKTRLAWEARDRLRLGDLLWLEAGCVSFGATIPYGPVLCLLRAALGIDESDPADRVTEKIEKGTHGVKGVRQKTRDALAYLLGEVSSQNPLSRIHPKRRKESLIGESIRYIKGLAAKRPVAVMMDDLHWADPLSVEWIDRLVGELGNLPVLAICLYRPMFTRKWPEGSRPTLIEIGEISDRDSRRLLLELLGVSSLSVALVEKILKRTRGNPFFIEELIYALLDSSVLKRRGNRWELARGIEATEIPDTLRNVVMARIDLLEVRLRRVLQCAAVIGRGFRYEVLEYVTDFQARLAEYVYQLVDTHFLIKQSLLAEWLYLFRHVIAHDVVYETLLKRRRAEFHGKVGKCIESLYSDHLERHYEFLAHHYYLSNDAQKAAHYLEKAAEKLERLYANEALVETLERLIEVLDKRLPKTNEYTRMRAEALIRLARAHYFLGEYEASAATYQRAVRVADHMTDGIELAAVARRNIADVDRILGRHGRALRHLDRAEEIWARAGDSKGRLTVYNSRGVIYMSRGDYVQAAKSFRRGVELARREGTPDVLANVLNDLGIACLHAGRHKEALETFAEALGLMEELGDKRGMAAALNNLGMCHERLGQFELALNHYGRSFELAQKTGYRYAMLANLINIGQCYQYQGDNKAAIRQFRRVVRMTKALPNDYAASLALGNWATNLVCLGHNNEVPARIKEARHRARASGSHLARVNADLAEVFYVTSQRKYSNAEHLAQKAIADIEQHGYVDYHSLAYRYLAEVLLGKKNSVAARRAVTRSLRLAEKTGNPRDRAWVMWTRARVELSQGRLSQAHSVAQEARKLAHAIGDRALLETIDAALRESFLRSPKNDDRPHGRDCAISK